MLGDKQSQMFRHEQNDQMHTHCIRVCNLHGCTFPFTYTPPTPEQARGRLRWESGCTAPPEIHDVNVLSTALRYEYRQYKDCIFVDIIRYNLMETITQGNEGLTHNHDTKINYNNHKNKTHLWTKM